MSELKAGAVYEDRFGEHILAVRNGDLYNAISLEGGHVPYGESVLYVDVCESEAFDDLRSPTKVADSLAEYYESRQ